MHDGRLGQVLVARGVITERQLADALAVQHRRLVDTGQAVRLGQVVTELKMAPEAAVLAAVNAGFHIAATSLSDNIRELIAQQRGKPGQRRSWPIFPIWLKLCVGTLFIVAVTIASFSCLMIDRQKARFFDQTVAVGVVSLNYVVNNARILLINDDRPSLNTAIAAATASEGIRYAVVTDTHNEILAHTDEDRIGGVWLPPTPAAAPVTHGRVSYFTYTTGSGERILNLTQPVRLNEAIAGAVHVGVSLDFIAQLVEKEKSAILWMTVGLIVVGLAIALFMGIRFSRPISQLVAATEAIGKGDYRHRVTLARTDELGNLAAAFNRMGDELCTHMLTRASFGKYVGQEVLDLILADPERVWLKGRKNEATILFADIRGFTAYTENREPEAVVEVLNTYFETATGAILDHGGYVDKFIGDGVLGVFGVPVYRTDHVERAVRAALDLLERLQHHPTRPTRDHFPLSSVGIGIHSGPVVSGNIGSQAKMEYTVIGHTVNLASRLSTLAEAGEILITDAVCRPLGDRIQIEAAGTRAVKGKIEPVHTYRVLSIEPRHYARSA